MKKILSIIILSVITTSFISAQTPETEVTADKDFSVYFPKKGDFALGIDLGNFLIFTGNTIFGNIVGNDYKAIEAFQSDIFGRYFLQDNMALRFRLGILIDNSTKREFVRDDYDFLNNPFSETMTVDTRKQRMYEFELGGGIEFRRTLWRLQAYAGGEVFIGYASKKFNFEYGNNITEANQTPSMHTFTDANDDPINKPSSASTAYRTLSTKNHDTFTYGLGAFVGADYFINRNLSIGVEFKLDGRMSHHAEINAVTEGWYIDNVYTKEEPVTPRGTSFSLRPTTYLSLMVYF